MKESKEKEHRISNLKDMIDNVKDEKESINFEDTEEDSELISYLNEDNLNYEELEIDDEFIYHPGDEDKSAITLEENPIDEEFIIKTPKSEDINENDEYDEFEDDFVGEISENFDNII
ncbi:MAG: topoisomerase IV, partial [Methanobrevibacter sp.]|nr:topoisomerase IV [Methanobrevibacter sp.]